MLRNALRRGDEGRALGYIHPAFRLDVDPAMSKQPDKPEPDGRPKPAATTPRSVRDGLAAPRGRRGPRRSGRGRPQGAGRNGKGPAEAEPTAADRSAAPPTRRLTTHTRTFMVAGKEWVATLVGSIRAPATTTPTARLLEVEVRPSGGGESRSGYVSASDLDDAAPGELERIAQRAHPDGGDANRGEEERDRRRKGRSSRTS